MLFDTSGAWMRPEGAGFICGIQPPPDDDPDAADDFEPAYALLEEVLWPALAHRIPIHPGNDHFGEHLFKARLDLLGPDAGIKNEIAATHLAPLGRSQLIVAVMTDESLHVSVIGQRHIAVDAATRQPTAAAHHERSEPATVQ